MSFIKDYVGKNLYKDVTEIADTPIDWNKFMNKTVLITGANGFIAYYLTLACCFKMTVKISELR